MASIWLVHLSERTNHDLALGLIGDFAVRAFGSMKSLAMLAKVTKTLPDLLVIDCPSLSLLNKDVAAVIDGIASKVPRLIFAATGDAESVTFQKLFATNCIVVDRSATPQELSQTIRMVLRQEMSDPLVSRQKLRIQNVEIDVDQNALHFIDSGTTEALTPKETKILATLVLSPGGTISRQDLKKHVWRGVKITDRNIDSHISRIRSKLSGSNCVIESVYGAGYSIR